MVQDGTEWPGPGPDQLTSAGSLAGTTQASVLANGPGGTPRGWDGQVVPGAQPSGPQGVDARGAGSGGTGAGGTGRGTGGQGAGRRVLVIEDEPNISEAIRFILRRDGWSVTTHDTGEGALARITQEHPDLVILDVMLPGQSGLDILHALRSQPGFEGLPVILLTARHQAATRELAQGYGASMFMAKPFANADLLAAVRQLVGV